MRYFRVEAYEGCGLTLSRMFETRDDAERYRKSVLAAMAGIVEVDKNGAAL
jgi:hypothetical protein